MKSDFKRIWSILNIKEKRKLIKLSILKFFSGIMDLIGVISIAPFIAVVSSEKILNENKIILEIKNFFNFGNIEIVVFLAIASLLLIILNQTVRILGGWYEKYVTSDIWWSLHRQMFSYYIKQPYDFHIQTNSNQLLEKLEVQTNAAVAGVIMPTFQIIGYLFTCLFLFLLLMIADPIVTTILITTVGLFYIAVYIKMKEKVISYGKFGPEYSEKTFKLVDQAFRSIKDIKIKNNAKFYINLFEPLAKQYANNAVKMNLVSNFPRFLLEIFAYTFTFSIIIYFIHGSRGFSDLIILIGIYAFSLQKIMPAIQGIYQQITEVRFYKASFNKIFGDLNVATRSFEEKVVPINIKNEYKFSHKIEFKNVVFKYPNTEKNVLKIRNLDIKAGTFLGITGQTGSGKTTLIDLLLGLLEPTSGKITIDGELLNKKTVNNWQNNIGYVPQFSFMADDSIKNNIALGQNQSEINFDNIKKATKIAELNNFIENDLPLKYDTIIGEDGIRLSGGQRQRISIARAFYKDQDIVILDEATSSLDNITERSIMNSILNNKKNKTIVIVTHRLSSLMNCDEILFLDNGTLVDKGTFNDLVNTNLQFKNLAINITNEKNY